MQEEESYLGGVASQLIGRLSPSNQANGFMVHGYGIFFTTKRLIGVSYRKITLVAYLIPLGIFFLWLSVLLPVVAWGVQNDPNGSALPLPFFVLGPPLIGLPILVGAFVIYLSPRRVAIKIDRLKPESIQDLMLQRPDIVLDRSNVSEIIIDRNPDARFYFPRTTIVMRTGEKYRFDIGRADLYGLLGDFCNLTPQITLSYKTTGRAS